MLLLPNSRVVLVVVPDGTSKKSLEEIYDLLLLRNSRVVLVVVPDGTSKKSWEEICYCYLTQGLCL